MKNTKYLNKIGNKSNKQIKVGKKQVDGLIKLQK